MPEDETEGRIAMTSEPKPPAVEMDSTSSLGIQFSRGGGPGKLSGTESPVSGSDNDVVMKIHECLSEAMNARHVAFLLGSGCSSYIDASGQQLGIATMKSLASEFTGATEVNGKKVKTFLTSDEKKQLEQRLGVNLEAPPFHQDLEGLMEVLYSWMFCLSASGNATHQKLLPIVKNAITRVKCFLLLRCTSGPFSNGDDTVQTLYESFYRKLVYRDRSLPRPWIFTTNYDLFNETAMDRLGLPYSNGFSGAIERRFNPTVFRYALAEQMDVSSKKWTAVDGFAYLCKLHGSVNWVEDQRGLFQIRELRSQPQITGLPGWFLFRQSLHIILFLIR